MIARSREAFDRLLHQFQALANGFKELKLHASRRHTFLHEELEHAIRDVRQAAFAGLHAQNLAKSWGKVLYLVFIGLVLYGAGAVFDVTTTVLVAYVLTLLYMRESVTKILDVVPDLTEAKVALSKIERGGFSIGRLRDSRDRQLAIAAGVVPRVPVFETLALRGVTHRYFHETLDRDFTLGPLDFTVSRGELVYVVGGNGSGKTTLAKVLTGLYLPESGEVSFNGKAVSDANREEYRQLFTATFSDFHIFDRLLGLETAGLDERSRAYLTRLQLDHKVSIQDGVFSTTDLSRGQRKRLVLLTAYLEDRPIYVFDEWAADQDPMFKDVFYRELLPDLKRRQKAVVVISHDDRYYDLGDRVVKLEDGQVVADQAVHPVAATLAAGMRG
jgi:putative ATP-binding cassette transporter